MREFIIDGFNVRSWCLVAGKDAGKYTINIQRSGLNKAGKSFSFRKSLVDLVFDTEEDAINAAKIEINKINCAEYKKGGDDIIPNKRFTDTGEFIRGYLPHVDNRRTYAEYYLLEKQKTIKKWQADFMVNMHTAYNDWCRDFRNIMQSEENPS